MPTLRAEGMAPGWVWRGRGQEVLGGVLGGCTKGCQEAGSEANMAGWEAAILLALQRAALEGSWACE